MQQIDKIINIKAYNSIEALGNFSSPEEIAAYRARRKARCAPVASFIAQRMAKHADKCSVAEVGSGSSALLYQLASEGILEKAVGIELSTSRFDFAEKWKADEHHSCVTNINQDFSSVELAPDGFDWFIVSDNTFTYLYPEDPAYPGLLLQRAFTALRKGGRILLDFINYDRRTPNIEIQQWNIFPKSDPFAYGLYSHRIAAGINTTESIFIKRDGEGQERKLELSKVYSLDDISRLLSASGFRVTEAFAGFTGETYQRDVSERLVVVGECMK